MTYDTYLGPFNKLWKNKPEPFNPDYKPYAKAIWDKAVSKATELEKKEQFVWLRKYRARVRRNIYDKLMKEHEEKLQ